MSTALSTAAVLATWTIVGAVVWGCGYAVRLLVVRLVALPPPTPPSLADVWTGVGVLTAYLLVWNLVAGIDARAWPPVVAVGLTGCIIALRRARRRSPPRHGAVATLVLVLLALLALWLANLSLGQTTAYDSGLYHLAAVDTAAHSAVVPGLGNLHIRLSSAAGHLLLVAFLGVGPWRNAGQHLANGFLLTVLLLQLGTLAADRRRATLETLSSRVSLLLVPAIVLLVASDPTGRVSSPSLDVACLVLVVAGGVLLTRAVESAHDPRYVIASGGALGAALATRPQIVPALVVGVAVLCRGGDWEERLTRIVAFGILPAACLGGAAARQTMLSGYPFFPSSWPAVGVDWRLDGAMVDRYRHIVEAWARRPGDVTSEGLGDLSWVGDWSQRVVTDQDLVVVLALAVLAPATLLLRRHGQETRRFGRAELLALIGPPAAMVAVWLVTAPDTRFAYGAILLLALGEVAWLTGASRAASLAAMLVLSGAAVVVLAKDGSGRVSARGGGPFGTYEIPVPETRPFVTDSGLVLRAPVDGDRCWTVPLCTPEPDALLELRGPAPASGFRLRSTTSP